VEGEGGEGRVGVCVHPVIHMDRGVGDGKKLHHPQSALTAPPRQRWQVCELAHPEGLSRPNEKTGITTPAARNRGGEG